MEHIYIPFWVIQEHLDVVPPDSFILCKVVKRYKSAVINSTELVDVCDLEIKPKLIAAAVPESYLIRESDIEEWATKIAEWFRNFPDRIKSKEADKAV